jgi:hypothetical protein
MGQVDHGQAWGVGGVPGAVGVKNGWLPLQGGWIVNSDGCVRADGALLCLSVLSRGSRTMASGTTLVEKVAKAVVRAWTATR